MKHLILVLIIAALATISLTLLPTASLRADQDSSAQALQDAAEPEPEDIPLLVMDQPLDGSSIEAFKEGLEKVDREASEKDYRSLMSSLDYLLYYDLSAKRKKELLYASLNGKSPNQIKALVASFRAH